MVKVTKRMSKIVIIIFFCFRNYYLWYKICIEKPLRLSCILQTQTLLETLTNAWESCLPMLSDVLKTKY